MHKLNLDVQQIGFGISEFGSKVNWNKQIGFLRMILFLLLFYCTFCSICQREVGSIRFERNVS